MRARLAAAASLLLAAPALAQDPAAAPPAEPRWQLETSTLVYGEKGRAQIVEPVAKITRLLPGGRAFSAQLGIDAMTGASPSGAMPAGRVQTTTTPSGNLKTVAAGEIPTQRFEDLRGGLDLGWVEPVGSLFRLTSGGHYSREKDYQSVGVHLSGSLDLFQRLVTVTVGGGQNWDQVMPSGGTPLAFSDGTARSPSATNDKRVTTWSAGVSRVLTRRWLAGATATGGAESGYLTDPYKVVSLIDPATGFTDGFVTENRPDRRNRLSLLGSSVYHLDRDVLYATYRWYRDDWGIRSHTLDFKLRHELGGATFLQPHLRAYEQSRADFFRFGLLEGASLPAYASSDQRLGPLRSATGGATYGFHIGHLPGEFTTRAEVLVQWGSGHPAEAVGAQRAIDLMPPEAIGSVLLGWTRSF